MGKFKRNIVFLIHILRGSGLFEFKWYNAHKLLCFRVALPPAFFFFRAKLFRKKLCFKGKYKISLRE